MFFVSLLLILGTGLLALLLRRRASTLRLVSVVGISAGCVLGVADAVQVLATRGEHSATLTALNTLPFAFRIDGLAAFFLLAIFVVALLATVYSAHYLDWVADTSRAAAGSFFLALLVVSMALVVSAASIIAFLLAWELMSLSSFFLVLYHFEHDDNRRAGLIYLVYSQLGALVLMVAFALLYSFSGDLILGQGAAVPESARTWLFVLFFIGFGSKAGVFPLHAWLPHAHPAAPSHVSAVMSGVMIKTGIYGILRVTTVLDLATPTAAQIVVVAGAASGVLGVVYALGQHDLKRLLAYHSVENIGIILLGLGLGMLGLAHQRPALAVLGFTGGLLHVLNHALFKSLLFLGAGVVQQRTGTTSIDALGGVLKKMRITGSAFIVGSIAISGLPPLNGFVSEVLVYVAGFQGLGLPRFDVVLCLLAILSLALIGGLALACFTKVVGVVFLGEPRSEAARNAREGGPATLVPMLVLTAICGIIGVLPGPFVRASLAGVAVLVPFAVDGVLAPTLAVSSAAGQAAALLVALVLGLWLLRGLLYHSKPVTRAATWGCGFTQPTVRMQYTGSSYASTLLEFFRPVAPLRVDAREVRGLLPGPASYRSHVQDLAEMAIERGVVQPVQRLFELLRWMQHGEIHLYIGYILLAIVVLLLFV